SVPSPPLTRRQLLGRASGAGIGTLFLRNGIGRADTPAATFEDRGSKLRIASLRGFRVGTKAYVKIETAQQITGWGEVAGLDPDVAVTPNP
ncbi:MAG: hypothetical protein HY735_36975, partial [Verrucomicrobia bacterium]|nr:hypothetical protein [Verrucomicrobiota bacterium]